MYYRNSGVSAGLVDQLAKGAISSGCGVTSAAIDTIV